MLTSWSQTFAANSRKSKRKNFDVIFDFQLKCSVYSHFSSSDTIIFTLMTMTQYKSALKLTVYGRILASSHKLKKQPQLNSNDSVLFIKITNYSLKCID